MSLVLEAISTWAIATDSVSNKAVRPWAFICIGCATGVIVVQIGFHLSIHRPRCCSYSPSRQGVSADHSSGYCCGGFRQAQIWFEAREQPYHRLMFLYNLAIAFASFPILGVFLHDDLNRLVVGPKCRSRPCRPACSSSTAPRPRTTHVYTIVQTLQNHKFCSFFFQEFDKVVLKSCLRDCFIVFGGLKPF
jgi:hypothetical protein